MKELINLLNSGIFFGAMKVLILSSAFVCGFILTLQLIPDEKQSAARKRLGVTGDSNKVHRVTLLKWLRPLYLFVLPYVAQRLSDQTIKTLHKKLLSANLRDELTPYEFVSFKIVLAGILPLLIIYITGTLGRPLPMLLWPAVAVGSYFFGDLWLTQQIARRRAAVVRALPYTLDLLTLSVEAGLDFIAAIQRLIQRGKDNALLVEFNHMLKEIRLGTSRSDALRSLSDRLQIEEISSFTTLLIQADQLGASIGNVLRAQSDQLRSKRFQAAEAAGARASQLILFPLVLCILPAIFLLIVTAAGLNFFRMGLF